MSFISDELITQRKDVESMSWEGVRYTGSCTCGEPFAFTEWRDTTPTCFERDRVESHTLDCRACGKHLGTYYSC